MAATLLTREEFYMKPKILKPLELLPFVGIEGLPLGVSKSHVIGVLGNPTEVSKDEVPDVEIWRYPNLGLDLTFSSDDDWLLGTITVESGDALLRGRRLIGLDEKELMIAVEEIEIMPTVLEDDFEDSCDYYCERFGLSFWVSDGVVTSITLFPEYDESGDIPVWPSTCDR